MVVLLLGLVAGLLLVFSLLDAVTFWPLPAWEVSVPGSTRGWQAAHVRGILNGVMMGGVAMVFTFVAVIILATSAFAAAGKGRADAAD